MVSTWQFAHLHEPRTRAHADLVRQSGSLRDAIKSSPGYMGFVISGLVWNFALQVAAPFFNVYLVTHLGADVGTVGLMGEHLQLCGAGRAVRLRQGAGIGAGRDGCN